MRALPERPEACWGMGFSSRSPQKKGKILDFLVFLPYNIAAFGMRPRCTQNAKHPVSLQRAGVSVQALKTCPVQWTCRT